MERGDQRLYKQRWRQRCLEVTLEESVEAPPDDQSLHCASASLLSVLNGVHCRQRTFENRPHKRCLVCLRQSGAGLPVAVPVVVGRQRPVAAAAGVSARRSRMYSLAGQGVDWEPCWTALAERERRRHAADGR